MGFYGNIFYIEETKRSNLTDDQFGVSSQRKFPLDTEKHVRSAIKFFNYVSPDHEEELATKIKAALKRYHITDIKIGKNNRFYKYYNN